METLKRKKKNKTNYKSQFCSFLGCTKEPERSLCDCASCKPNQGRFPWALLLANPQFSVKLWLKPCWGQGPGFFLVSFSHGGAALPSAASPWLGVSGTGTSGTLSKDLRDLSTKQTRLLKLFGSFQSKARTLLWLLGQKESFFHFFPCPPTLFAFLFCLLDFSGKFFSKGTLKGSKTFCQHNNFG